MTDGQPFDLSDILPAPRDDEPASLRKDIADELADHLACSLQREQLRGGDESTARKNVLTRFGDPVAVARRLWRDAMWEKIMLRRFVLGYAILATVLLGGLFAFTLTSIRGLRQALDYQQADHRDALSRLGEVITQSQDRMRQEIQQLRTDNQQLKESADRSDFSVWNPVELRLVRGTEDGPPAEGIRVSMVPEDKGAGLPPMKMTTDQTGIVRFPRVRYGVYQLSCSAPVILEGESPREGVGLRWSENVSVGVGEPYRRTIICPPESESHPQKLTLRIDWPADLKDQPIWWMFYFSNASPQPGGFRWYFSWVPGGSLVLLAPDGTLYPILAKDLWGDGLFQRRTTEIGLRVIDLQRESFSWIQCPRTDFPIDSFRILLAESGRLADFVASHPDIADRIPFEMLETNQTRPDFLNRLQELLQQERLLLQKERPERGAGRITRSTNKNPRLFDVLSEVDASNLQRRIEPTEPATLWITPSEEMIAKVREAIAAEAARQQKWKEAEENAGSKDSDA